MVLNLVRSCVAHVVKRYQATLVRMEMNSVSALYSTTHSRIWLRHSRIPGALASAPAAPLEPPSAPARQQQSHQGMTA